MSWAYASVLEVPSRAHIASDVSHVYDAATRNVLLVFAALKSRGAFDDTRRVGGPRCWAIHRAKYVGVSIRILSGIELGVAAVDDNDRSAAIDGGSTRRKKQGDDGIQDSEHRQVTYR